MKTPDRMDAALLHELQDLAAISLSADEAEALREKLQRVVGFLAEIDALEFPDPPSGDPPSRLREDLPQSSLSHESALRDAPGVAGPYFRVLPVLPPSEESDASGGIRE